jgi:parvulin-like peptidyl-prolyl isomerase
VRILTSVVLAATLVSACGGGGGAEMARVGDSVVTEGDLAEMYASGSVPVGDAMRQTLYWLIARQVLVDAIESDLGIPFDEDEAERLYQSLVAELEAVGVSPADAFGVPDAGLGVVRFNADLAVIRGSVTEHLVSSSDFLDDFFASGLETTTVCAAHILVETREEADDAILRLEAGEDFGDLADELSQDAATPRGDLGCRTAGAYVLSFAQATLDAPLGEVHGPVETQFGWHVVIVAERTALDRAAVEADPLQYVPEGDVRRVWETWVDEQLRAADVEVVARYGTWSPMGILAPTG